MLWEGFNLMLIGMGTVFVFLILLVLCTQAMSRLVLRYFPALPVAAVVTAQPVPTTEEEVMAAVSAAVHHHRKHS